MNNQTAIKMVGNWSKEMETTLAQALSYTYQLSGRSLAQACRHAIILMAQSARKLTPQARKKRRVKKDQHGRYVEYDKPGKNSFKMYEWQFNQQRAKWTQSDFKGTFEQARNIGGRGIGKRSWMWGLAALNKTTPNVKKPIPGVSVLSKIVTPTHGGFILSNRLNYIEKIMPAGWLASVERAAANKIMKQAQMRLQRKWERTVARAKTIGRESPDMGKYIREAS